METTAAEPFARPGNLACARADARQAEADHCSFIERRARLDQESGAGDVVQDALGGLGSAFGHRLLQRRSQTP
jgi:hypothetical protein